MKTKKYQKVVTYPLIILFSLLFIASGTFAQKDYDLMWEEVEALKAEGRTKSGAEKADEILAKAKKERNDAQRIKALLVGNYFINLREENSFQKALDRMYVELEFSNEPSKSILHSAIGEMYDMYVQGNLWNISDRTPGGENDPEDISTWTKEDLLAKADEHFDQSLEHDDFLKNSRIEEYDIIWDKHEEGRMYRPTVFDILTKRVLDHYQSVKYNFGIRTKGALKGNTNYFANRDEFIQMDIEDLRDEQDLFKSFRIYQQLLAFHMSTKNLNAVIYNDLERLKYVFRESPDDESWKKYEEALLWIIENDAKNETSAEAYDDLARMYQNLAVLNKWEHTDKLKKSVEVCNLCIVKYPESRAAKACTNLRNSIMEASIHMEMQEVNMINKAITVRLRYKNVKSIYLRLVDNNHQKLIRSAKQRKDESIQYFISQEPLKEWKFDLPDSADYRSHRIHLKIDGVPKGYFALIASIDPDFKTANNIFSTSLFWSSDLAYLFNQTQTEAGILVMNRQNGNPIKGATVELYREEYDYQQRASNLILEETLNTDKDGFAKKVREINKNENYKAVISFKGDTLLMNRSVYFRKPGKRDKVKYRTATFTDRKVYRPGQKLYFKTIVMEQLNTEVSLSKEKELKIYLYDANNQEVSKLNLKTNEFGSVNGVFTIPGSALTGRFYIDDGIDRHMIMIEEYKRPSFEVKIDKPKGNASLDQNVSITGKAISYNGVPLSSAKGRYVIQRKFFYCFPYGYYYPDNETLIDQGEFTSDANGNFEISFVAKGDDDVDKDDLPVFDFSIEVFVSDITGETQSAENDMQIGYHTLEIRPDIEKVVNKDETKEIRINTTNLSYQFIPAKVEAYIMKLESPSDYLKKSPFMGYPDFYLDKVQYEEYLESRYDETWPDYDEWKASDTLLSEIINTADAKTINVESMNSWQSGVYRIYLRSTDAYGQEVFIQKEFVLFGRSDQSSPIPVSAWIHGPDKSGLAGENVAVLVASVHKDAMAYYMVSNKKGVSKRAWLSLKGGMHKIEIPLTDDDRGGIEVEVSLIYDGQSHFQSHSISVPYDNKEMKVKLESHRDKMKPGDTETWKMNLSLKYQNISNAEVLVSMYDKSLDVIYTNPWWFVPYNNVPLKPSWDFGDNFDLSFDRNENMLEKVRLEIPVLRFDDLNWFEFRYFSGYLHKWKGGDLELAHADAVSVHNESPPPPPPTSYGESALSNFIEEAHTEEEEVPLRKNFKETAFFYPNLKSDENGDVEFSFEVPDALTKWYFQAVAVTEDLKFGRMHQEVVSQKELMVLSNYPRFVTAGDTLRFTSKISNLTEESVNAKVSVRIVDPLTQKELDVLKGKSNQTEIEISASNSESVQWLFVCPDIPGIMDVSVFAETEYHRDGESKSIPILSRSILVTETYPISLRGGQTKKVKIQNLDQDMDKKGIDPHRLTLEFTPNPVWHVVQALPYLEEKNDECVDQKFNRFYANSIGFHIVNSDDRIHQVFKLWKSQGDDSFQSELEKNPELKNIILSESPWLNDAMNEKEDKQKVAMFFDANNVSQTLASSFYDLLQLQSPNGGWPWFEGMKDNMFVTQNIVNGFGRLKNLGVTSVEKNLMIQTSMEQAAQYLDNRMEEVYREIISNNPEKMKKVPSSLQVHYLMARSYYPEFSVQEKNKETYDYFYDQATKFWLKQDKYEQAMISLIAFRKGDAELAKKILLSLTENSIMSDEFGMYWKEPAGYGWNRSGIARQAMIIEAFDEVNYKTELIDEMKVWLLKQKQTHMWRTGKATTEACFAMMVRGGKLISQNNTVDITMGRTSFVIPPESNFQAGTNYTKMTWSKNEISPEMNEVQASNKGESVAWGAVYYQFFQDSDKISSKGEGMTINREYYLKKYNESGAYLDKMKSGDAIKTGDVVIVKMIIKTDRNMEFVHLKDMRAGGLEPIPNTSGYQWMGTAGYYLSIRDASTNYYFDYLAKGSHIIEFEMKANNAGNFTTGIGTIQSFYSPEFSAHSKGIRLSIEDR